MRLNTIAPQFKIAVSLVATATGLTIFFAGAPAHSEATRVLKFGGADWCPYSCGERPDKGLAAAKIQKVLDKHGMKLDVQILPWARATKDVEEGRLDGLLTAVPSEAPGAKFTTTPTMSYQVCFFGKKTAWNYSDAASLDKVKIGVMNGYSYGEPLDTYVKDHPTKVTTLSGLDSVKRLSQLVAAGRIDVFPEDINVFKAVPLKETLKTTGCLPENPFFIGFSPKLKDVDKIIAILNEGLK